MIDYDNKKNVMSPNDVITSTSHRSPVASIPDPIIRNLGITTSNNFVMKHTSMYVYSYKQDVKRS